MLREKERKKERKKEAEEEGTKKKKKKKKKGRKKQFTSEDECFKEPLGNAKIENEGNVDDGGNDGDDNK